MLFALAPSSSTLSSSLFCSLGDDHHSQLQAAGLTQSGGGVGVRDAAQCLSVYGQQLISLLNGAFLSRQAAGKHFVDLMEESVLDTGHRAECLSMVV